MHPESGETRTDRWFKRDKNDVHEAVIPHVRKLEEEQDHIFERFFRLDILYDPLKAYHSSDDEPGTAGTDVSENLIASNIDTVTAIAAATEVRPRFTTDGATWGERRKVKKLARYAEGIAKQHAIHAEGTIAFKGAALKGTGLVKVWADEDKNLRIEEVAVDDVIVDELECRYGRPRQLHHRVFVDRDTLADAYPKHRDAIYKAQTGGTGGTMSDWNWTEWAGYRSIANHQLILIESWYLPSKGRKGRHTLCIDGLTLFDKEWTKDHFPFAKMVWSERRPGWYGIGGAERIAGHQRRLNKYNWQLDRWLDNFASPVRWVHISDANLQVKQRNSLGTVAAWKHSKPETIFPPALSPDMLLRRSDLKDSAYEEFGTSRLAATATKPAGIESGAALREYRDATTQRFALQEKAFEKLILDIVWLAIDVCKDLGKAAPDIHTADGERLKWGDVDMGDVRLQLQAASNLPNTPAGRRQLAIEISQAGLISGEEARRLLGPIDPLDLEASLSPFTSAVEHVDWMIEEVLEGGTVIPEQYGNLQLGVVRFTAAYQRALRQKAPLNILENLRQWIVLASSMLNPPAPPAPPPMPGEVPGAPMDPGMAPPMAPPMPGEGQPTAALAPEAMVLS